MGKYEKYCQPLFLRQDEVKRAFRPGTWVFGQEYRFLQNYCKDTPLLVEYIPIMKKPESEYAKVPVKDPKLFHTANVERDGHKGGGYEGQIRHEAEMLWIFIGTDPKEPRKLGAHIEFNVGFGEDRQVLAFDEPACVHLPRGLANCGMKITNQTQDILQITVFNQPTKEACYIEHTYYPIPDDPEITVQNGSERRYNSSDVECEQG